VKHVKDQLTLFDRTSVSPTSDEGEKTEVTFAGLEGRALDEAWLAAGSPLPVPHGCIPLPFSA
jgi:hypothetical protein